LTRDLDTEPQKPAQENLPFRFGGFGEGAVVGRAGLAMVFKEIAGKAGGVIFDQPVNDPIGFFLARENLRIAAIQVEHLDVEARSWTLAPDADWLVEGLAVLVLAQSV